MKRHLPNAITSANLVCGCIAIQAANEGHLALSAGLILLAAFFDFFDGLAARLLGVSSEIGKQLDSLADVVSFGVAPSFVAFSLLRNVVENPILAYLAFTMAVFSAVRLAKFNIDDRQSEAFIGLPTPANALFWVGIALSYWQSWNIDHGKWMADSWIQLSSSPLFLLAAIFILSFALVAEIPLFSLKFKSFGWKGNEWRFTLLLLSLIFIALFLFASVPIILLLYLLLSIIQSRFNSKKDEVHS